MSRTKHIPIRQSKVLSLLAAATCLGVSCAASASAGEALDRIKASGKITMRRMIASVASAARVRLCRIDRDSRRYSGVKTMAKTLAQRTAP